MARILVTGNAGLLGSHLANWFIKTKHDVWGIDDLSNGDLRNVSPSTKFVQVDLKDKQKTNATIMAIKPDIIYHLAAWPHEGLSQFAPIKVTENNFNIALNVLIPAIKNKVKKFIFFSSMARYGNQEAPFSEDMPTKPHDIYAVSKVAFEQTLQILGKVHDIPWTIIVPHNVFGIGQSLTDPYRNVIGIFMNRIMQGKPPIIYGDGNQKRAFSYIDNFTPYAVECAFNKKTDGEIINIGPTKPFTINYLTEIVLKAFESDLKPIYYPDRPQEVKFAYCTVNKAKKLLDYKTTIHFERGIAKMVAWAKNIGPEPFRFLDNIELGGENIPKTWSLKEM